MAEKKTGGEQSADSEVLVQVRREIASHLFRTAWLEIAAFSILGIGLCFALGPYASRLRESVWIFLLLIVSAARSAHVYFTDSDAFYSGSRGSCCSTSVECSPRLPCGQSECCGSQRISRSRSLSTLSSSLQLR